MYFIQTYLLPTPNYSLISERCAVWNQFSVPSNSYWRKSRHGLLRGLQTDLVLLVWTLLFSASDHLRRIWWQKYPSTRTWWKTRTRRLGQKGLKGLGQACKAVQTCEGVRFGQFQDVWVWLVTSLIRLFWTLVFWQDLVPVKHKHLRLGNRLDSFGQETRLRVVCGKLAAPTIGGSFVAGADF